MTKILKTLICLLVIIVGLSASACFSGEGGITVVGSISLTKTALNMEVGEQTQLSVIIEPENASNKNVIWTSSNKAVAEVERGKITAKSVGDAIITATTVDGSKTAICTVRVHKLYTVTFIADDLIIATETYSALNKEIKEPIVPTKDGYLGKWESYELTNQDLVINAVYELAVYKACFVADGVTVDIQTYTYFERNLQEPVVPEKIGYTAKWEEYELADSDIVIKAQYTPINYSITFVADAKYVATETYTVENKAILEPEIPKKEGYAAKWEEYTLTYGNVTVNAVYTPIDYTVTFVADGSDIAVETYTVENKAILEPEIPKKEGYAAKWEEYTLTHGNVTVNAMYEKIFVVEGSELISISEILADSVELHIPTVIDGVKILSVKKGLLSSFTSLQNLTIPFIGKTLDGSGDSHFGYIFGDGSITEQNRYIPSSLKVVNVAEGVTVVGAYAFNGCDQLENITVPNTLKSINDHAFKKCDSLKKINIPEGVYSIGREAFRSCGNLSEIIIPSTTEVIDSSAFMECRSLVKLEVAQGNALFHSQDNCIILTESKKLVFGCQTSLIPNDGSVTSIGRLSFDGQSFLKDLVLPHGIVQIEADAFYDCNGIEKLVLPRSVKYVENAFRYCSALKSIVIPKSVEKIDGNCFVGCENLTICIEASEKPNGWAEDWNSNNCRTIWGYDVDNEYEKFVVTFKKGFNDQIISCATYFFGDTVLPPIVEDEEYNYIYYSFIDWDKEITVATQDEIYVAQYEQTPTKWFMVYFVDYDGSELFIGKYYYGQLTEPDAISALQRATRPNDEKYSYIVKGFGEDYNAYCVGDAVYVVQYRKIFTDGQGVQYEIYEDYALVYGYVGYPANIVIPSTIDGLPVVGIGENAFRGSNSLKSVIVSNGVKSIENRAFQYCSYLEKIEIPLSVENIKEYCFSNCCDNLTIYAETNEEPSGWIAKWNAGDYTVVWGYKEQN